MSSIFFECKGCGCFTPSKYSEILIRDKDFKTIPNNQKGFIQLLSILPKSYPGHSILTEDIGEIVSNNCKVCKTNKKFKVYDKNEKGKVVVVRFGDPNMSINRDDPKARKSFRARHQCDTNPGPKWKARYWSCFQWRAGSKVDN